MARLDRRANRVFLQPAAARRHRQEARADPLAEVGWLDGAPRLF